MIGDAVVTRAHYKFNHDIDIGANKLRTTNLLLKEKDSSYLEIRNSADTDWLNFYAAYYHAVVGIGFSDGAQIRAVNGDGGLLLLQARDTGVGLVEIARLVGAADPYFQATLPMRILPVATGSLPATPLEGMLAYDVTAHKLKVYVAAAWETVTSA